MQGQVKMDCSRRQRSGSPFSLCIITGDSPGYFHARLTSSGLQTLEDALCRFQPSFYARRWTAARSTTVLRASSERLARCPPGSTCQVSNQDHSFIYARQFMVWLMHLVAGIDIWINYSSPWDMSLHFLMLVATCFTLRTTVRWKVSSW